MAGTVIQEGGEEAMSDINVVPLTDVMLVLLIVFLITTQVIKQAVPVKLPDPAAPAKSIGASPR
jgi:biopolymer transport protein ExbD